MSKNTNIDVRKKFQVTVWGMNIPVKSPGFPWETLVFHIPEFRVKIYVILL